MNDSLEAPIECALMTADTPSGRLRLDLVRHEDRVCQRLWWCDEDNVLSLVARSEEGNNTQDWPPSPAFQEARQESIDERPVVLLTGMSGRNHWSLSVELLPDKKGFLLDAAVRVDTRPPRIGSCYRLVNGIGKPLDSSPEGIAVRPHEPLPGVILWRAASEGTRLETDTSLDSESSLVLRACPADVNVDPPATLRWKYSIEIADHD